MTDDHITRGPGGPCIERDHPLENDDGYCIGCRRNDVTGDDGLCDRCRTQSRSWKPTVKTWMLVFDQKALNLKQLRRLYREWKHHQFTI